MVFNSQRIIIILPVFNCVLAYLVTCHGSVSISSVAQSCPTLWNSMNCSTPGLPVHHQLPESTQTHFLWVSDAIQPSHHLSSPSLPVLNLSQHQGLFQWVSSSHQVAKYWSFSFNVNPFNALSGLISFRMHWLHLLAVQGTHRSLLQHHSSISFYSPTLTSIHDHWKNHSLE